MPDPPFDNLQRHNESDTAIVGPGPDISRFFQCSTNFWAIDARSKPGIHSPRVIDHSNRCWTRRPTPADAIRGWAAHLAPSPVSSSQRHRGAGIVEQGPCRRRSPPSSSTASTHPACAVGESVSVGSRRDHHQPAIEQLLGCWLPECVAIMQAISLTDKTPRWECCNRTSTSNLTYPRHISTGIPARPAATDAEL